MPRVRRHMDANTATRVVTFIQKGHIQRALGLMVGFSRRPVQNVWNRYQETGNVARRFGSGRVRVTTAQEDRYIRLTARRWRTSTVRTIQTALRRATGTRDYSESTPRGPAILKKTFGSPPVNCRTSSKSFKICKGLFKTGQYFLPISARLNFRMTIDA